MNKFVLVYTKICNRHCKRHVQIKYLKEVQKYVDDSETSDKFSGKWWSIVILEFTRSNYYHVNMHVNLSEQMLYYINIHNNICRT